MTRDDASDMMNKEMGAVMSELAIKTNNLLCKLKENRRFSNVVF